LYFWNAESGRKINRFAGNANVAFGHSRQGMVVTEDQFFEFKGQHGETLYGFRGGSIASFPSKAQEAYRGSIRKIAVDKNFTTAALAKVEWDSIFSYGVELLSADSLVTTFRSMELSHPPLKMVFSPSGNKLAYLTHVRARNNNIT